MTRDEVLQELLQCLSSDDQIALGWEQVREWPEGTVEVFQEAGWIKATTPAESVECPGCEEGCFMPVHVLPGRSDQCAQPFVACDRRDDMGKVRIAVSRLQQWQLTRGQLVRWIAGALGLRGEPDRDGEGATHTIGTMQGKARRGVVELDAGDSCLRVSGHVLPLVEAVRLGASGPAIDRAAVLTMVDLPPAPRPSIKKSGKRHKSQSKSPDQPAELEVGSPEWRRQTARKAANARHERPGGSREKQQQMREIWASGKYTTRDICAEQECAALGMSFAAARRALRNTPDPEAS